MPVPNMETVSAELFASLEDEGFVVTNTRTGGIFATIVKIVVKCHIELIKFAREIIKNTFISSAEGSWLELKAGDFSKERKLESKTVGTVTLSRVTNGDALTINKGTIFKTERDENGDELKFIATEDSVMVASGKTLKVPIIADTAGSRYNVAVNRINRCLINLEGIDSITNTVDWIVEEGADTEDIESLRNRTKLSWAELATLPIRDKYKNACEAVSGVLLAEVIDDHPRGQGTVDIYITGTAGQATDNLLNLVRIAVDNTKGPYDNVLVQSTATVVQGVSVVITMGSGEGSVGVSETAKSVILDLLAIKAGKELNRISHTDIIHGIKSKVPTVRSVKVVAPVEDVTLDKGKILVAGEIKVVVS